jgi:ATP-binding cassette subfamily C (CFTR/MRP) protein 1
MENCLLSGPLSHCTRVLVTHSLSALPYVDYIYVLDNGRIVEQGTYTVRLLLTFHYSRLTSHRISLYLVKLSPLSSLSLGEQVLREPPRRPIQRKRQTSRKTRRKPSPHLNPLCKRKTETRARWTGTSTECISKRPEVSLGHWLFWLVWYLLKLRMVGPYLFLSSSLPKLFPVVTNLFLGWWTSNSIKHFKQTDYMGLYSGLGLAQTVIVFINVFIFRFAPHFLVVGRTLTGKAA